MNISCFIYLLHVSTSSLFQLCKFWWKMKSNPICSFCDVSYIFVIFLIIHFCAKQTIHQNHDQKLTKQNIHQKYDQKTLLQVCWTCLTILLFFLTMFVDIFDVCVWFSCLMYCTCLIQTQYFLCFRLHFDKMQYTENMKEMLFYVVDFFSWSMISISSFFEF